LRSSTHGAMRKTRRLMCAKKCSLQTSRNHASVQCELASPRAIGEECVPEPKARSRFRFSLADGLQAALVARAEMM
jgi:hypothetical protein